MHRVKQLCELGERIVSVLRALPPLDWLPIDEHQSYLIDELGIVDRQFPPLYLALEIAVLVEYYLIPAVVDLVLGRIILSHGFIRLLPA